jgi:phosphopantetheinyl transferase (holo-ACP synthase)
MRLGNDIVDLLSPYVRGKSRDVKFVRRILTIEEQETVLQSADPDSLLQVYWAAKETAYKAIVKTYPDVSSAPRRYPVFLSTPERRRNIRGYVQTPAAVVPITVIWHREFVHCLGAAPFPSVEKILYGIKKLDDRMPLNFRGSSEAVSREARAFAKRKIASALSVHTDKIVITTDSRAGSSFPEVYLDMKKTDIDISLSHDGRFIAYALLLKASFIQSRHR